MTQVDRTAHRGIHITREGSRAQRAHRARAVRYMAGFGVGVAYGVHDSGMKNLARGVVERVLYVNSNGSLKPAPQPKTGIFNKSLKQLRNRLLKVLKPTPIVPREDYPLLYTGRKQGIYRRAAASLALKAVNRADSFVSTFVKAEKVNLAAKPDPVPRVIQPRSPRYLLEVGRYLKKFEKELLRGFRKICGYDVILKGMNATEVAEQMRENWESFKDPVAIGLDASRFDQHVSKEALLYEHSIYNGVFRNKELASLLEMQLHNRGIGRAEGQRLDYRVEGKRMSGDINTGMGNCLIMTSIILAIMWDIGISFRLSNNGDDCVLFLERADLAKLASLGARALEYGFNIITEAPVYVFEQVVFCQAQPVYTSTGWRMTRDPRTAMSKDCVSLLGWDNEGDIRAWAYAIGQCGLSLTTGIPVWQHWYARILGYGRERLSANESVNDSGLGYMSKGVTGGEISEQARYSFWLAFGIEPDLQVALEQDYSEPWEMAARRDMISSPEITAIDSQNPLTEWLKRPSNLRCP